MRRHRSAHLVDSRVVVAPAGEVQAMIASLILDSPDSDARLGSITLAEHQLDALARIHASFAEFRGALLCDAVGSGKTFIALAIARGMRRPVVIAPAALRGMWTDSMRSTAIRARFITIESLSRTIPRLEDADCLIVDEAHHFRNRSAKRHRALSQLSGNRAVLLITATPIHNSKHDLETLASLFLGSRAAFLSDSEIARLVVRRERGRVTAKIRIPRVTPTEWLPTGDDPATVAALMALPPPVPFRDSGEAAILIIRGLLRQWASSEAALAAALRRRIARSIALEQSLEAGEYPSEREMRSWLAGDDAVQLGFPGLLGSVASCADPTFLRAVRTHSDALRKLAAQTTSRQLDEEKADQLRRIARRFRGERIVAFASYDATVHELFRRLSRIGHIGALTSRGGRVAGGRLPRSDIVRQFSPDCDFTKPSDRIDILLTTDLLSEGINLQRASIIVHLDIPWTAARMEQRVGRLARAGSLHDSVRVFAFRPPPSVERILRASAIVAGKWLAAARVLGYQQDPVVEQAVEPPSPSPPELHEAIRAILAGWRNAGAPRGAHATIVGAASSAHPGFLAAIHQDGKPLILASDGDTLSSSPSATYRVISNAIGRNAAIDPASVDRALQRIREWVVAQRSSNVAGLGYPPTLGNRRKVLARIDSITARLPPHERSRRAELILHARQTAASDHNAWEEAQIDRIAGAAGPDAEVEWLERIAEIGSGNNSRATISNDFHIRALLILVGPTASR